MSVYVPPNAGNPVHMVALGSSFASGPGIAPAIDRGAGRSGQNYAHILAERLKARLTDLSVSGATLSEVLDETKVGFGRVFPPQVAQIPPSQSLEVATTWAT
jgi:hypothetical protein